MAKHSAYEAQLQEACRLVAERVGAANYQLVYQSRSGAPHIPWLEPDILDHMEALSAQGITDLIIHPIGFISDHMEVLYDLDTESVEKARELGMEMVRSKTVGTHPTFISMIRELIVERMTATPVRQALGVRGPNHDICPLSCCLKA
jgi:ferrochelatase